MSHSPPPHPTACALGSNRTRCPPCAAWWMSRSGDVTGDGTPVIALSFRRPYRRTLLNASLPRRFWTDADGLSAHVGLYRMTDLSEIWVAGTLVRPVRRLAACTGAIAVAYSTLRRPRIVATSAWRWQGFAFLPLPELPGRGTPTCIDIDRDGRSEAAMSRKELGHGQPHRFAPLVSLALVVVLSAPVVAADPSASPAPGTSSRGAGCVRRSRAADTAGWRRDVRHLHARPAALG